MADPVLPPVSDVFVTVCKVAFKPLVNDNDLCPITNIAALQYGLQALLREDSSDYERANELWAMAQDRLVKEQSNLIGAGAEGNVQMDDSFDMEHFPVGV
jgi:hypothetical protein